MKTTSKDYKFVTVQFLLFALYFFEFPPKFILPEILKIAGLFAALVGFFIASVAVYQLNRNLTVFPTPKENANLVESGLYKFSRHPIYSGIILMTFGTAFYLGSFHKLFISFILLLWFYLKSQFEEKQLEKFYSNYSEYKSKRGRFFPKFKF